MEISTVKGFKDIFQEEALRRKEIRDIIEKKFISYGFLPIETPTIEYEDLLKVNNDEAVSDMFKVIDRGERKLGLRYEFTVQLSRIFKENTNIKLPFRRYQIGNIFRDEPTKKGRYREFTQCDADIIGDSSINADAECLALAKSIFNELDLKIKIKINNRKLLNSILKSLDIKKIEEVIREIDKLDKLGTNEIKNNLSKIEDKKKIEKLFSLFNKDLDYFKGYEGYNELKELIKICKYYKIKVEFVPYLARGFSYYTGNVFEIFEAKNEYLTITAGGRYDKKVGQYVNKEIPAVGISFGLDRIAEISRLDPAFVKYLVVSMNKDKEAIEITEKLREKYSTILMFGKISKALDYADKMKIENVIIIGEKELKEKKVLIKNMKSGKEQKISINKLLS